MYFDASVMKTGAGAGLLFISPLEDHMRYVIRLHFPASNNMAEYVWRNHPKLLGPGALIFVAKQL